MTTENTPAEILVECGVLLGSFAKGNEANKRELMEDGVLAIMMQGKQDRQYSFCSVSILTRFCYLQAL